MKLWLLKPATPLPSFWQPWYDKAFGFLIRAETEEEARKFAQSNSGDETRTAFWNDSVRDYEKNEAWTSSKYSTCTELLPDGEPGVILKDFQSA